MSFFQALGYFTREAFLSLVRSWKISLLAVLTIAVSLILGGVFLLVSGNLRHVVEGWKSESKVVIYLRAEASGSETVRMTRALEETDWALDVELVSAETAHRRFRRAFPSLSDLLEGWGENPLPTSIEVGLDWQQFEDRPALEAAFAELRADPAVSMIDDDRDWLNQLEAVVFVLEALGLVLGAILLVTAIFTISSVIRLTAFLYREEIAVMRLVGATEFFIRGPFYVEGLMQGLLGGAVAVTALFGAHLLVLERYAGAPLSLLASRFLAPIELLALIGLGGLAGLVGAVTSLRRESLGQTAETPGWAEG
ncbi:MAG: ABC transporter permease [bacterium]|nr:ABC transporter permease [bacterium]